MCGSEAALCQITLIDHLLLLCFFQWFDTDGWVAEGSPAHRKSHLTDPRGPFPEQVEDEDLRGTS